MKMLRIEGEGEGETDIEYMYMERVRDVECRVEYHIAGLESACRGAGRINNLD